MLRHLIASLALLLAFAAPAWAVTPEKVVSPGGIEAWLVQDHKNPIIAVSFAWRGGAATDPAGKAGLANLASGLLDEGAAERDSFTFQKTLEDNSISLSFDASADTFGGRLQTLTDNRELAFSLLHDAVTSPRFDAEPVERIRSQIVTGLTRELANPNTVANRAWWKAMYPDHPYGVPSKGYPETVKAVTLDDLRAFVKSRLGRDNLVVGVVGDVTPAELGTLLDRAFGALPAKAEAYALPVVQPKANGQVVVIDKANPQSVVVFGQGGIQREDPDWYIAYVMNYVLGGGGFSSRLMTEVREKRGLAYGVYSYLSPLDFSATMVGGVATDNARVAESIELIRAEWARMQAKGPTQAELDNAKTFLTGSFPLQLDSTGSIAGVLVSMQLDNLGIDYLDKRNDFIRAVTLDDIRRVAGRLLKPEQLAVVVVGQPQGLKQAAAAQ